MIFTLHRYIFNELFRVFVLATASLTLMLSGVSLIPLFQKYGISPSQTIYLLGCFLPIMLTFVLPMSALFAASLVYGRFAADRELDACRASGISLWTMIYPGLTLAILVAVANLLLSFYVAPTFIHRSESSVKANAEQILFRNIERKGSYTLPQSDYRLYADNAVPEKKLLEGVVILDSLKGDSTRMITAEKAKVQIETYRNHNEATVVTQNAYEFDESSFWYLGNYSSSTQFPSLLTDKIKFQKIEQIKQIQADKLNYFPVREMAMAGRAQLAIEILCEDIQKQMAKASDYYPLDDLDDARGISYLLSAGDCYIDESQPHLIRLSKPVRLLQVDRNRNTLTVQYDCSRGYVTLEGEGTQLRVAIKLENPSWQRPGISSGRSTGRYVPNIRFPSQLAEGLKFENTIPTLIAVEQGKSMISETPSGRLKEICQRLQRELVDVDNEIYAELNTRLVLGLGCIPLILTGIALGIKNRGGHMLSAFGASAIPGAILIIFILSGKELTRNPATPAATGVALIWVGLVALLVLTLLIYRKLLRT